MLCLAWEERLLANHLVNDPDAFAKKNSMSLRLVELLFGDLRDDNKVGRAAVR